MFDLFNVYENLIQFYDMYYGIQLSIYPFTLSALVKQQHVRIMRSWRSCLFNFLALCMEVYGEFFLGRSKIQDGHQLGTYDPMAKWQIRIYILHINY